MGKWCAGQSGEKHRLAARLINDPAATSNLQPAHSTEVQHTLSHIMPCSSFTERISGIFLASGKTLGIPDLHFGRGFPSLQLASERMHSTTKWNIIAKLVFKIEAGYIYNEEKFFCYSKNQVGLLIQQESWTSLRCPKDKIKFCAPFRG